MVRGFLAMDGPSDEVRDHCRRVVASASWVTIDDEALAAIPGGQPPPLDPVTHLVDGDEDHVAAYVLALDAINFGSGWFPTLRLPEETSGYELVAGRLAERFRAFGPWSNPQLRDLRVDEIAELLGQDADHELMGHFARALRELGGWLGQRTALDVVAGAGGSAQRLVAELAAGMQMWRDTGFYKRAQIAASDLALAGVGRFGDLDRLTIFADNLIPHVLRVDGALRLDPKLAAHIDAGRLLEPGEQERELRAAAVVACERLAATLGMSEPELDNVLWTRGQGERYTASPAHLTRTTFY
jgi:hypothetical protein